MGCMEGEYDYSWTNDLWDYVEEGYLPTNSEEIFNSGIDLMSSDGFRMKIDENRNEAAVFRAISDEGWGEFVGFARILRERGYTERNFRIMVQQCIGGVFEPGFVIGEILRENGIQNQWSEDQSAWDRVLDRIREL